MKKCLIAILLVLFAAALPVSVYADCEIASFDQTTRTLKVCVGEFATSNDLKSTTVIPVCRLNSNGGFCRDVNPPPSIQLGSLQDINKNIRQDPDGKYYTCLDFTGINRAIGSMEVKFENSGTRYCTTKPQSTVPGDWNFLKEGLPGQQGTNDPRGPSSKFDPFCPDGTSINTAIGCIPTDPQGFITKFLGFGVGVGGGIAFLLILFGGLQIMTSAGNPEKLNAGKELVSAAISGLLLIIFSLFLLRLIGYNILGIPGFG